MKKFIPILLLCSVILGVEQCKGPLARWREAKKKSVQELKQEAGGGQPFNGGPNGPSEIPEPIPTEAPRPSVPEPVPTSKPTPPPVVPKVTPTPKVGESNDTKPNIDLPTCPPEKLFPGKINELAKPFVPSEKPGQNSQSGDLYSLVTKAIIEVSNRYRKQAGVSQLTENIAATRASQEWSDAQAKSGQNTCNHVLPGRPLDQRMQGIQRAGCNLPAENVSWNSKGWFQIHPSQANRMAEDIVKGWYESEGHRRNLLSPTARSMGAAISVSGNGAVFGTQIFCRN